jgi:hypothetical protein
VSSPLTDEQIARVAERVRSDFGKFAFEGFGIKLSDEQLRVREVIGTPGIRQLNEAKYTMLSGGTRSGKTVLGFLMHAEACLYKHGVDRTDGDYWFNYDYGTLAGAPSDELALRMHAIGDAIQKKASPAQWDERKRTARDGAFLSLYRMGKQTTGGISFGVARFTNGAHIDFRTFEGGAYRLEGGQWWFFTWDEWASQPDAQIHQIKTNVLTSRARDHDAKIVMMAWPKPETEHHLLEAERGVELGQKDWFSHQIVYLSAESAFFTNRKALAVEKQTKTRAEYMRTVLGRPAGGAMVEFKEHMLARMFRGDIPEREPRLDGYAYITTADLGLGHDSTVCLTGRIPIVNGKPVVAVAPHPDPWFKLRIVNGWEMPGSETRTLDQIAFEFIRETQAYSSRVAAVDATSMGGLMAFRALREVMRPAPLAFVAKAQDRIHGNIRLAAITNGLDFLTWGRSDERSESGDHYEWGLVEAPRALTKLHDQMANFDRDAKERDGIHDDWVWALLIMLWYVKRYFLATGQVHRPIEFDVRRTRPQPRVIRMRRVAPSVDGGVRLIQPR